MKSSMTNVLGFLDVTNAILPYMRARKSGTIAIIGSRSSWRPELTVRRIFYMDFCLPEIQTLLGSW